MQPITRAELVDYLDQRERISANVLKRIERRLELIEQRLTLTPDSPAPQNQVALEPERSRRRRSAKTDARLRVRSS